MSLYSTRKKRAGFDLEKSLGSYSDMFANLCLVFLLLYVVVTMQNIVATISGRVDSQKLTETYDRKVQEIVTSYDKQLQAFRDEKDAYLREHAPRKEADVYDEAMKKLASLEEEKKQEIDEEVRQLRLAQEKLNEVSSYKTLLKSIIDSKYVTQARMKQLEEIKARVEDEKKRADTQLSQYRKTFERRLATEVTEEQRKLRREISSEYGSKLKDAASRIESKYSAAKSREAAKHQRALAQAMGSLEQTRSELKTSKGDADRRLAAMKSLKAANEDLQGDVESLKGIKTDRDKLVGEIAGGVKSAFEKAGLGAETNLESGEVVIFFPDTFFGYGSAKLKPKMKEVLGKAVPIYANTVFGSRKHSKSIGWIEIVGFASPTFLGKYVDPVNMSDEARRALNYNMDLSYRRAKAIFEFIFDRKQMKFPYQKNMVLLTKVSGRSYLAARDKKVKAARGRALAAREYCQSFNCAAEQRVAIRFHLREGSK